MKNIYNEPKLLKNIGLTKKRITFLLVLCYGPSQVRVQISFPRPTVARPPPTVPWGCLGGVHPYLPTFPNPHYYTKFCTTHQGLQVVSAGLASPAAMERAAFLLDTVLAGADGRVAAAMARAGFRHAVMAAYPTELTTNLPEHAFLPDSYNERARGLGATPAVPLGSSAEENLLCLAGDRYRGEDITVHEFAHSVHLLGLNAVFPTFDTELRSLYRAAKRTAVWGNHYAMTDHKEYWAEAVQSYYNANARDGAAPGSRAELQSRDPAVFSLIVKYIGWNNWTWACPHQQSS